MRSAFGIAGVALLAACGCQLTISGFGTGVRGSGVIKEETREVADFTGIDIGSALNATITTGPKATLTLSGDDNILPLIKTEVREGVLVARINSPTGVSTKQPIKLTITAPRLESIKAVDASRVDATVGEAKTFRILASDATNLDVRGINTVAIDLKASDASRVTVAGQAKQMTLEVSDASTLKAADLPVESVKAAISDASRVEVRASASIEGKASDASSIHVLGNPASRNFKTSDASRVSYASEKP